MKKNLLWGAAILLLVAGGWGGVIAYRHHQRMSWRPPHRRLVPAAQALRNQFYAAVADGTGMTNVFVYPNRDNYLKWGADTNGLEKGKQIGDALVSGDFTAFAKLKEMEKAEYEAFHAERTNWNHQQYNELAGKEQMRIESPSRYAIDIWLKACLSGNKKALEGLDYAFEVPDMRYYPMHFLSALSCRGNEKAFAVFLAPTNYGVPDSLALFPLKAAAATGDQRAINNLVARLVDKKQQVSWFMIMEGVEAAATNGNEIAIDALADIARSPQQRYFREMTADGLKNAAAAGNEVAIDTLITLSTNSDGATRNSALAGLNAAAANHNTNAVAALQQLAAP